MPYTTGAQGPDAEDGAQGPLPRGSAGVQGLWGTQGQLNNKPSPFLNYPVSSNLDILSVRLEVQYTLRCGNKYAIWIDRTLSSHSDILDVLPDDLVQMANLMDFKPRSGLFRTSAAPDDVVYHVAELGGFDDNTTNLVNDSTALNYVPAELGL